LKTNVLKIINFTIFSIYLTQILLGMNLNFFTATFPYLKADSIVENEIPILSNNYDKIKIFPHYFGTENYTRKIEDNNEVCRLLNFNNQKLNLRNKGVILKLFLVELFNCKNKIFYLKQSKKWLSLLKIASKKAQLITEQGLLLENSINYTYWMNDWALVLTILKSTKKINNFVFRCGGFDIWDERHEGNYLPFRYTIYKYADKGYPNAKIAEVYMKAKTPFGKKIEVKYLGTTDNGIGKFDENDVFTIVTVAFASPLKRVYLMFDILENVTKPIKWVHFGGGTELENLKKRAESFKSNHSIEFKGSVANSEILDYYKSNTVNLYMMTSSTESLPVSIQEAISFGVPVISTNVGGITEVVNDEIGILIDKDFDPKEVATIIKNFAHSKYNSLKQRQKIRNFWKDNFEANKVYSEFANEIKLFI